MSEKNPETWSILRLLEWTATFFEERGLEKGRLEAEWLLSELLALSRIELYTQFDRPLVSSELEQFRALVKRRAKGEPVAYILGHQEFWTLDLDVDPRVLIPRPDTETLVRETLRRIDKMESPRVLDIGTGSGAVVLSLASERSDAICFASDNSVDALEVAKGNAKKHDLQERITFFSGDLFAGLPQEALPLDCIVSNPPYIGEKERGDLSRSVLDFEPSGALFSGADGLDLIRRLILEAPRFLKPQGWLLLEIGYSQGSELRALFESAEVFTEIEVIKDYGGNDRVAAARLSK